MKGDLKKDFKIMGAELLNLVNLEKDDLVNILKWRNSDNIRKWMFNEEKISLGEHLGFIENLKRMDNRVHFLVKWRGLDIGVIQIYSLDFDNRRGEWGYFINPEVKDKGFGVLLGYLAIEIAFKIFKLNSIRSTTMKDNKASLRMNDFLGMSNDGILREYIYRKKKKKFLDVIEAGILSDEWKGAKIKVEKLIKKFID